MAPMKMTTSKSSYYDYVFLSSRVEHHLLFSITNKRDITDITQKKLSSNLSVAPRHSVLVSLV